MVSYKCYEASMTLNGRKANGIFFFSFTKKFKNYNNCNKYSIY